MRSSAPLAATRKACVDWPRRRWRPAPPERSTPCPLLSEPRGASANLGLKVRAWRWSCDIGAPGALGRHGARQPEGRRSRGRAGRHRAEAAPDLRELTNRAVILCVAVKIIVKLTACQTVVLWLYKVKLDS